MYEAEDLHSCFLHPVLRKRELRPDVPSSVVCSYKDQDRVVLMEAQDAGPVTQIEELQKETHKILSTDL